MTQVDAQKVETAHRHVGVAVDEARDDATPLPVHDDGLRAPKSPDLRVAARGDDPSAARGERRGLRSRGVSGPDPGGNEDEVGRGNRRRRGAHQEKDRGREDAHAVDEWAAAPERAACAAASRATATRKGEHDT